MSTGPSGGRLSDIKSILNHAAYNDAEANNGRRSPYDAPSPASTTGFPTSVPTGQNDARLDRREQLKRERERMRQALEANERELEELGD